MRENVWASGNGEVVAKWVSLLIQCSHANKQSNGKVGRSTAKQWQSWAKYSSVTAQYCDDCFVMALHGDLKRSDGIATQGGVTAR